MLEEVAMFVAMRRDDKHCVGSFPAAGCLFLFSSLTDIRARLAMDRIQCQSSKCGGNGAHVRLNSVNPLCHHAEISPLLPSACTYTHRHIHTHIHTHTHMHTHTHTHTVS